MTLSKALTEIWELAVEYCAREKIDIPDKAVEARRLLENMIIEIEKPNTYEDVKKAREIWFKELLEIFLPDVLNKMIDEGKIRIPSASIDGMLQ